MEHKVVIYIKQKDIPAIFDEMEPDILEKLASKVVEVSMIEDEEDRAIAAITQIIGYLSVSHRAWCSEHEIKQPKLTVEVVQRPGAEFVDGWNMVYEFDRAEDAARFDQTFA